MHLSVDDSREVPSPRAVVNIDTQKAALLSVSEADVVQELTIGLSGNDATYLHIGNERRPSDSSAFRYWSRRAPA